MAASTPTVTISYSTGKRLSLDLPRVCLAVILSEDRAAYSYVDCASGKVTIGRDEENDLTLLGVGVSRLHAIVERRGDRWFLIDKSLNGTRCNGAKLTAERQLDDGDRIRIERTVIVFLCTGDARDRSEVTEIWSSLHQGERMPFPIAVLRHLVLSCSAPIERVRALIDAIDGALRFHAAVVLSNALLQSDKVEEAMNAVRSVRGARLRWERVVFAPSDKMIGSGALAEATLGLRNKRVGGIAIAEALLAVDRMRPLIVGRPELDEQAHAAEIPFLDAILGEIVSALRPYEEYTLFSVARMVGFERDQVRYELFEHRGACEIFPIVSVRLGDRLQNDWCYLRPKRGPGPSIPLAPFVRFGLCSSCGRKELSLATEMVLGPPDALVPMRSVTTSHSGEAHAPDDPRLSSLHERFGEPPRPATSPLHATAAPVPAATSALSAAALQPSVDAIEDAVTGDREPRILFLAASPQGMPSTESDELESRIEDALAHAQTVTSQHVRLKTKHGLHARDLQTYLNDESIDVLHVSAHGSVAGEIYLSGEDRQPLRVEPADLAASIGAMESPPKCVVLCACHSALGVEALARKVGCVVAMKLEISVDAASDFCFAFYRALASGRSVADAVEQGKNQIANLREGQIPDVEAPVVMPGTHEPEHVFLFRRRHPTLTPE